MWARTGESVEGGAPRRRALGGYLLSAGEPLPNLAGIPENDTIAKGAVALLGRLSSHASHSRLSGVQPAISPTD